MQRFGTILALAAVLILTAIQLSPAIAPFFAKDGQTLQICTLQGIKTIVFDADGNATEQSGEQNESQSSSHCPLCMVRSAVYIAPNSAIIPVPDTILGYADFDTTKSTAPSTAKYTQYRPRDPPFFRA